MLSSSVPVRDEVRWEGGGREKEEGRRRNLEKVEPQIPQATFRYFMHEMQLLRVVPSLEVIKSQKVLQWTHSERDWGENCRKSSLFTKPIYCNFFRNPRLKHKPRNLA